VRRARRSDPQAWETLFRDAYAPLVAYAERRLGGRAAADDAVAETFARAYEAIDGFKGRYRYSGVHAWLFSILRDVVLETKRASELRVALGDLEVPAVPPPRGAAVANGDPVRAAFDRLPDGDRELLELRVDGLGPKGAGAVLGCRPGAVRRLQSRALSRLYSVMAEEVW
jgi:RNA polymerase sigma factor (sigma-70 family)